MLFPMNILPALLLLHTFLCSSLVTKMVTGECSVPSISGGTAVLSEDAKTISYKCNAGLVLAGIATATCDATTNSWNPAPPTCVGGCQMQSYLNPSTCSGGDDCRYAVYWWVDGNSVGMYLHTKIAPAHWTGLAWNKQHQLFPGTDAVGVLIQDSGAAMIGEISLGMNGFSIIGYMTPDYMVYDNVTVRVLLHRPMKQQTKGSVDMDQCLYYVYPYAGGEYNGEMPGIPSPLPSIGAKQVCLTACAPSGAATASAADNASSGGNLGNNLTTAAASTSLPVQAQKSFATSVTVPVPVVAAQQQTNVMGNIQSTAVPVVSSTVPAVPAMPVTDTTSMVSATTVTSNVAATLSVSSITGSDQGQGSVLGADLSSRSFVCVQNTSCSVFWHPVLVNSHQPSAAACEQNCTNDSRCEAYSYGSPKPTICDLFSSPCNDSLLPSSTANASVIVYCVLKSILGNSTIAVPILGATAGVAATISSQSDATISGATTVTVTADSSTEAALTNKIISASTYSSSSVTDNIEAVHITDALTDGNKTIDGNSTAETTTTHFGAGAWNQQKSSQQFWIILMQAILALLAFLLC